MGFATKIAEMVAQAEQMCGSRKFMLPTEGGSESISYYPIKILAFETHKVSPFGYLGFALQWGTLLKHAVSLLLKCHQQIPI